MGEDGDVSEESLTTQWVMISDWCHYSRLIIGGRARREHGIFRKLLGVVPHLEQRLMECTDDEAMGMAELVCVFNSVHMRYNAHCNCFKIQKGVSCARSDDTKSLKGAVLDWITPRDVPLNPPLSRNIKTNRGYHHPTTGAFLCPAGIDWNNPE
jgi:hypothetical protein